MATLQIRKKATKTWLHIPSDHKQYIVSKLYCKFNGDMFRVIEWGGRQRAEYHFSDITIFDDTQGGAPETFGSAVALMLRLEALEYIGFPLGSGSGGVGFQPTIVNPLNGQTLIYNSTTGIWHNGYIDVEGNRFLQIVEIPPAVGNVLTIPIGFIWVILNDTYSLLDNWVEEIPYTSEEGMIRKDIIVAIAGNNMIRIEGQESDTNPLEPTVPPNTLLVTQIDVFHDSIGEPTVPIVGDNYIPKASQGWVNVLLNSAVLTFTPTINDKFSLNITSFTSGHIIPGLNITTLATKIWAGGFFCIRTGGSYPITLKHLGSEGKIRFSFKGEEDFILTEDDGVLFFKLGTIPTTGNAIAYCLNAPSGSGGPTSADQVTYDNTASGLLAETVQEAVDEISENYLNIEFKNTVKYNFIKNKPFYYPDWWDGEKIPIFIEGGLVKYKYAPEYIYYDKRIDKPIYYISPSGNNSNDGLTPATAKASVINAYDAGGRYIKMLPGLYYRNSFLGTTPLDLDGNDLIVEGLGNVYITHGHKNISWSSEGGSVYSANRASVVGIFDSKVIDSQGLFKMYIQKSSLEEVELEEYTWFQDGSTLYVNKPEGLPDNNLIVNVTLDTNNIYSDSGFFWYKNINFVGIRSTFRGKTSNSTLVGVIDNCTFNYPPSHPSEIYDTISFENVYHGVIYKTQVSNSIRDGLNYSSNLGLTKSTFLEIDVTVKNVGNSTISSSANQTSTAHNGVKILRINGSYVSESGDTQLIADVNEGTQAILVGCELNSNSENLTINYYGCDSYLFACKLYGNKPVKADPSSVESVTLENCLIENKELSTNVIILE